MNLREIKIFLNNNLITKQEVLESLEDYRMYCENSEEDWSLERRDVILRILDEFRDEIEKIIFPTIVEKNYFYTYRWLSDGIVLELAYCDDLQLDETGGIDTLSSKSVLVMVKVRCAYLTVEEYAKKYNITETTVRQWIRRGKIRSAQKRGRDWLIPELADKPKRGYEPVTYSWEQQQEALCESYPYLKGISSVDIWQTDYDKSKFEISLRKKNGSAKSKMIMGVKEREKLELALISDPNVSAKEWFAGIQFIPSKRHTNYIKGGKVMKESCYHEYEKVMRKMKEDNLELQTNNYFYDEDGMCIWGFSVSLIRNIYDEDEDECREETLAKVPHGIIIPAEAEFAEENVEYCSAAELCDSISADMIAVYSVVADIGEGIKPEILREFQMEESEAYESSILYIDDIKTADMDGLKQFLQVFEIVMEGLPQKNCGLAVVLLNWEQENEKVKIFLEQGWRVRNLDASALIAYKGLK